jgi:translation elongation factor EF-1alpha
MDNTYLDRMKQELKDLQKKTLKLGNILDDTTEVELNDLQMDLLVTQFHIMRSYITILSTRINNEKDKYNKEVSHGS